MNYRWMKFRDIGPWHFALDLRELDEETRKAIEGRKQKSFRCRCGIEFMLPPVETSEKQPDTETELACPRCVKCLHWDNVRAERKAKADEFRRVERVESTPTISAELVDARE